MKIPRFVIRLGQWIIRRAAEDVIRELDKKKAAEK